MAIMVRTCCCGCDLRTGVFLIGIFGLLYLGYQVYSNDDVYKYLEKTYGESALDEKLSVDYKYFNAIVRLGLVGMAFGGISILANALLLSLSVSFQRDPYLAFPFFFWNILMLLMLYTFGLTIFIIDVWKAFQYIYAINIAWWLLSIYFISLIIVVYSYIQTLRQDPSEFDAWSRLHLVQPLR